MAVRDIYTEADFESMGWHDCHIHAIAVETLPNNPGRLLLDIDYLVEWLRPDPASSGLAFMVSPATLVFDQAWDLVTNIDMSGWAFQLPILEVERDGPDERGLSTWRLAGDQFELSISSRGFTQYLRREPVFCDGQWLSVEERGGFSFAEQGFSATPT
jgi:hypothetical protein